MDKYVTNKRTNIGNANWAAYMAHLGLVLIGSRRLGFHDETSDYDFVAQIGMLPILLHHSLGAMMRGFRPVYYTDDEVTEHRLIMRLTNLDETISIGFVTDFDFLRITAAYDAASKFAGRVERPSSGQKLELYKRLGIPMNGPDARLAALRAHFVPGFITNGWRHNPNQDWDGNSEPVLSYSKYALAAVCQALTSANQQQGLESVVSYLTTGVEPK